MDKPLPFFDPGRETQVLAVSPEEIAAFRDQFPNLLPFPVWKFVQQRKGTSFTLYGHEVPSLLTAAPAMAYVLSGRRPDGNQYHAAIFLAYIEIGGSPICLQAVGDGEDFQVTMHHLETATGAQMRHAIPLVKYLKDMARGGGRVAILSEDEKRTVLAAVIKHAKRDGTPPNRLALADAAAILDEWCEKSQPVKLSGYSINLPSSISDYADTPERSNQRRIERLKQWMMDVFHHKNWAKARAQLQHPQ